MINYRTTLLLLAALQLSAASSNKDAQPEPTPAEKWVEIDQRYRDARAANGGTENPRNPTPQELGLETISNAGGGYCNQYSVIDAAEARGLLPKTAAERQELAQAAQAAQQAAQAAPGDAAAQRRAEEARQAAQDAVHLRALGNVGGHRDRNPPQEPWTGVQLTERLVDIVRRIKTEVLPGVLRNALANQGDMLTNALADAAAGRAGLSPDEINHINLLGPANVAARNDDDLRDIKERALNAFNAYPEAQAVAVNAFMARERNGLQIALDAAGNDDGALARAAPLTRERIVNAINNLTDAEVQQAVATPSEWRGNINDIYSQLMGLLFPHVYLAIWNTRTNRWEQDVKGNNVGQADLHTILYLNYTGGHYEAFGLPQPGLGVWAIVGIVSASIVLLGLMIYCCCKKTKTPAPHTVGGVVAV